MADKDATVWPVEDEKARFSEILDRCLREGPQVVTRRETEAAVLVPIGEWRRLQRSLRPSLKELLLTDWARAELSAPARAKCRRRRSSAPA